MKHRSRLSLTVAAPLAKKVRARAAKLGTSQSDVIEDALGRHLIFQQLDQIEGCLAKSKHELEVLLEVFAAMAGPLFPQLMAQADKRVAERDSARRPDRDN